MRWPKMQCNNNHAKQLKNNTEYSATFLVHLKIKDNLHKLNDLF